MPAAAGRGGWRRRRRRCPTTKQITRARAQGEEGDLAEPKSSCEPVGVRGGGHAVVMRCYDCLLEGVPFGVATGHFGIVWGVTAVI